jgi:hypothetical protein
VKEEDVRQRVVQALVADGPEVLGLRAGDDHLYGD